MVAAKAASARATTSTTQHGDLFVHAAIFATAEIRAIIQTDEFHEGFKGLETSACTSAHLEEMRGTTDALKQSGVTLLQGAQAGLNRQL